MRIYWKIAERQSDGAIKTLFHGVDGSRVIPWDKWIEAEEKMVNDGSGPTYLSGWHVLPTYKDAYDYLQRFTTRIDKLTILPCHVRRIRPKEHSPSPVKLARFLKLLSIVVETCNYCGGAGWKSDDSYSTFECPWCEKGKRTIRYDVVCV